MAPTPLQPTDLLHYLPQHRVLICKECHYAIQPSAVSRHLKELHRIYRSNRREFLKFAGELDLADPKDVALPGPNEDPVHFLTTTSGLACEASGCDHLCATLKRMKMHWAAEHTAVVAYDSQWRQVELQTFFRGNQLRYFIVSRSSEAPTQAEEHSDVNSEAINNGIGIPNPSAQCNTLLTTAEDLKLLQHFQTSTCLEIGYNDISRQVWHIDVPELAAKHPFLKHGILACSALHLAFLQPAERQRYQLIAAHHQNMALPEFRIKIENPNTDNALALLAFTQLLLIHCFAADQHDDDLLLVKGKGDLGFPLWLKVIRGSCQIFQKVWPDVECLPFKALVIGGVELGLQDRVLEKSVHDERLRNLMEMMKSSIAKRAAVYQTSPLPSALFILVRAYATAEAAQARDSYSLWVAVSTWPVQVGEDFLLLLKEREPAALVLLAYYCLLFQPLERNWYINGYSRRLLSRIHNQLDEEWRPWLQWPIQEIGLPNESH